MKCPEKLFDKRSKKWRECGAEIYGMTGLQELQAYQRHLRKKHRVRADMWDALNGRAISGQ